MHIIYKYLLYKCNKILILCTEAVYVTGDLWEQMLVKEKEKVKALEERYAERLRAEKVFFM